MATPIKEPSKALAATKHHAWKWIGALFMEPKSDGNGKTVLAASLTKVLTLAMFAGLMTYWWVSPDKVPDSMVQTMWGLLGMKSVQMVGNAIRSKK